MEDLQKRAENLRKQIAQAAQKLKLDELQNELDGLRAKMAEPGFWQDNQRAQQVSKQEAGLAKRAGPWLDLGHELEETSELIELGDPGMKEELSDKLLSLESRLADLKKDLSFSGPYDDHDVILSIYAGAGGTDAQDWAQMLERMYLRWAEKQGLNAKVVDESPGEEAGIKSA
ncbi:MAG TPA: PCRF domain-containing protein, partial [Candidatus Saccharimonadales bacterium]|nr:PCRF domain-containing protein [Candidatus Saccharimonadales bacterium]